MSYPDTMDRVQFYADLLSELLNLLSEVVVQFGEVDTVSIYYNTYSNQWVGIVYGDKK